MIMMMTTSVRTLFQTKHSRTLKGLSRTHFPFFKDSIQCEALRLLSLLVLPQHEQFYPENISVVAPLLLFG